MKIIKKITLLSLALFFAFSVSAFAQKHEDKHGKHHNQEQKLEKMKTELGLSDTQVEQIKALHEKKKEENRTTMKANRAEFKAEIDKILTPEQRKKAEALQAERKDPNNRAEKHVEKMKTELSLSDAQATKIKAALVTKMTKMQALKEAAGEEKVDKSEHKALKTTFETELKSILSSEQFTKYEAMKKGKKGQPKRKVKENNSSMER